MVAEQLLEGYCIELLRSVVTRLSFCAGEQDGIATHISAFVEAEDHLSLTEYVGRHPIMGSGPKGRWITLPVSSQCHNFSRAPRFALATRPWGATTSACLTASLKMTSWAIRGDVRRVFPTYRMSPVPYARIQACPDSGSPPMGRRFRLPLTGTRAASPGRRCGPDGPGRWKRQLKGEATNGRAKTG